MLWFLIHNWLKNFTSMENQTRKAITFLTGTVLYSLLYYYLLLFYLIDNNRIFSFFMFVLVFDVLAIGILYKDVYKLKESKENIGSYMPKIEVEETTAYEECESKNIPLLNNDSDYVDENEGFTKDSALGNVYNTNGNSNAY